MSDITVNFSMSNDSAQRNPNGNRNKKNKKKNKWSYNKMQHFKKGKPTYNGYRMDSRPNHTTRQNGAFTNCPPQSSITRSVPHLTGASHSGSGPSTSTHSKPSLRVTVNYNLCNDRPGGPVNTHSAAPSPGPSASSSHRPTDTSTGIPTKYLAIDCEMVGAGPKGSISQLARCSIVSHDGDVVYDKFITPPMPITDYRTRWSGIRRSDLYRATPYTEARKEILRLLKGKVVVGHAIHNDFKALSYTHPIALTRDTSRIPLLNVKAGFGEKECASLKRLTKAILKRDIQVGKKGHSSVEDAKATMELYKVVEKEWEQHLASKPMHQ